MGPTIAPASLPEVAHVTLGFSIFSTSWHTQKVTHVVYQNRPAPGTQGTELRGIFNHFAGHRWESSSEKHPTEKANDTAPLSP